MRIRFPGAIFVIFSLFVISVGCCLLVPLIWNDANLAYFLTIHSYARRSQTSGIKLHFNVDQATKIKVRPEINAQNSFTEKIIIEDPGKIKLAKQFIQDHADGWLKRKDLDLLPLPIATIVFYDSYNRKLDAFAIGGGNILLASKRSTIDTYWKYVENDQLRFFIEVLGLPDKAQFSIFRPGRSFTTKPGSGLQLAVQYLQHPAPTHQSHQPAFGVHHRQSLNVMGQEQAQGFQ
jgi:hypothetical protein